MYRDIGEICSTLTRCTLVVSKLVTYIMTISKPVYDKSFWRCIIFYIGHSCMHRARWPFPWRRPWCAWVMLHDGDRLPWQRATPLSRSLSLSLACEDRAAWLTSSCVIFAIFTSHGDYLLQSTTFWQSIALPLISTSLTSEVFTVLWTWYCL
jgi:hypothetical protein